jgi:proliferating cell nuclear antigen PCNA
MTVSIKLEQAKFMKTIVDAMVSVSDDVAIEINENGFRAQAIDIGKALVVDAFLNSEEFTSIDAPVPGVFHIDLDDFTDFIKTAKSNDVLLIRDNDTTNTLDLQLKSSSITKRLSLRLNDVQNHRFMKIKNRTFFSNCKMDAELFAEAVKAAELGDEHVTLNHSEDKLHFSAATTTRTAEATIHYAGNEQTDNIEFRSGTYQSRSGETLEIPKVQKATYGLKFLKRISRIGRVNMNLQLSMSDKEPLRIIYPLNEKEDEEYKSYVAFAVAPRLLEEERG